MMIHQLPDPIRDSSHVRITSIREAAGSGLVLHFQLGSLDGEGAFQPDSLIRELQRFVREPLAKQVRDRAAAAGAPTTGSYQEWRRSDLLAVLDAEGWEP